MDSLSKSVGRVADIYSSPSSGRFVEWLSRTYDLEWARQIDQLASLFEHPKAVKQYADWIDEKFNLFILIDPKE